MDAHLILDRIEDYVLDCGENDMSIDFKVMLDIIQDLRDELKIEELPLEFNNC